MVGVFSQFSGAAAASDYSSGGGGAIVCNQAYAHIWYSSTEISWSGGRTCSGPMSTISVTSTLRRQWGWWFWQWEDVDSCANSNHGTMSLSCGKISATQQLATGDHEIRVDFYEEPPAGYSPPTNSGTGTSAKFKYPN
jgi:hypothetical protein